MAVRLKRKVKIPKKKSHKGLVKKLNSGYQTSIQRSIGFSKSQLCKLRYVQQVQLNPATSSSAYIIYSANGPFQPNVTASASVGTSPSHQPYGYDQWSAIYNDYVVLGSKMMVTAIPPSATVSAAAGAGPMSIMLSDSATGYTNPTTLMETGRTVFKQLPTNASSRPVKLSHAFSTKKFWRLKDVKDNVTRVGSDVGSNPAEQAYYHIYFWCNDTSVTTTAGPYLWVVIDYAVLFTGPKDLAAS